MPAMTSARSLLIGPLLSLALALSLAGCGDDDGSGPPVDTAPRAPEACTTDAHGDALTTEEVLAPGPYAVGQTSYSLVDTSRTTAAHAGEPELPSRTLKTAVWYPAVSAGPDTALATGGPFPLVLYSHGYSSLNQEGKYLNALLASRGYVVFAPQFPLTHLGTKGGPVHADAIHQPDDVSFVLDQALAMSAEAGHLLEGAVDPERIAAVGLSLGGMTTLLVTFHRDLRDPRIDVAAAMAPPADFFTEAFYDTRVAPLLILGGTYDAIVDYEANDVAAFERANPPVNLYTLIKGTHTGFASYVASLASAFDNLDEVGCDALVGTDVAGGDAGVGAGADGGVPAIDLVEALGGADAGIVASGVEVVDCQGPFLPSMTFDRQRALEQATISTFLDAYLASDASYRDRACHYHERVLPYEADDVEFRRR
jgi:dienelactone hydrolase